MHKRCLASLSVSVRHTITKGKASTASIRKRVHKIDFVFWATIPSSVRGVTLGRGHSMGFPRGGRLFTILERLIAGNWPYLCANDGHPTVDVGIGGDVLGGGHPDGERLPVHLECQWSDEASCTHAHHHFQLSCIISALKGFLKTYIKIKGSLT